MQDFFQRVMDSSDPIIADHIMQKRTKERKKKSLPIDVYQLLSVEVFSEKDEIFKDMIDDDNIFLEANLNVLNDIELSENE